MLCMILSDKNIIETYKNGSLGIEPFSQEHVQPASYDLGVGDDAARSSGKNKFKVKDVGYLSLQPGDFCIVTTQEKLSLDNKHTARFDLTSSYAKKGLIATTGAKIDPGFKGVLVVGLTNLSGKEIILPYHDRFLTVEFHRLVEPVEKTYSGQNQGREGLDSEDVRRIMNREIASLPEIVTTLQSLVRSTDRLDKELKNTTERFDKELKNNTEKFDKTLENYTEKFDTALKNTTENFDRSLGSIKYTIIIGFAFQSLFMISIIGIIGFVLKSQA